MGREINCCNFPTQRSHSMWQAFNPVSYRYTFLFFPLVVDKLKEDKPVSYYSVQWWFNKLGKNLLGYCNVALTRSIFSGIQARPTYFLQQFKLQIQTISQGKTTAKSKYLSELWLTLLGTNATFCTWTATFPFVLIAVTGLRRWHSKKSLCIMSCIAFPAGDQMQQ